MKIEAGKWYWTRDGRRAYIYKTDARGECPVHGYLMGDDRDYPMSWAVDGFWRDTETGDDLVEEISRITKWINVYWEPHEQQVYYIGAFYTNREDAESARDSRVTLRTPNPSLNPEAYLGTFSVDVFW